MFSFLPKLKKTRTIKVNIVTNNKHFKIIGKVSLPYFQNMQRTTNLNLSTICLQMATIAPKDGPPEVVNARRTESLDAPHILNLVQDSTKTLFGRVNVVDVM